MAAERAERNVTKAACIGVVVGTLSLSSLIYKGGQGIDVSMLFNYKIKYDICTCEYNYVCVCIYVCEYDVHNEYV